MELLDDGQQHDWEGGVLADGPAGKGQWAVMGEGNLKLDLGKPTATYAPTTYHEMGSKRSGSDATFKLWAPDAKSVQVKVTDAEGKVQRFAMERDEQGTWSAKAKGKWNELVGKSYVYEVVDSTGVTSERPDPYAREMMGEQRGLSRMYLDAKTGHEVNRYAQGGVELMRFDIDDEEDAHSAYLVLKDASGRQLNKAELEARLGSFDASLVDKLHEGKANNFWSRNVEPDGRIRMTNEGGAWSALVNDLKKLVGLRYELQVYEKDERGGLRLRDDGNRDGRLNDVERRGSTNNDPWSDAITEGSGVTFRGSVITDPTSSHTWKHDNAPREKDPSKWVVYQLHMGSFLGEAKNADRSTLEDLTAKLDYFKKLGVNTLELLPVNEVEGNRNWGYLGVNSLAVESSFGFEDQDGKWVSGTEALKRFIDEAHAKGNQRDFRRGLQPRARGLQRAVGDGRPGEPILQLVEGAGEVRAAGHGVGSGAGVLEAAGEAALRGPRGGAGAGTALRWTALRLHGAHQGDRGQGRVGDASGDQPAGPLPQPQRMDGGGAVRLRPEHHASDAEGRDGGRLRRAVVHGVPAPAGE